MGNPDTACIAFKLQQAVYRPLFEELWGKDSLDIKFPHDTEKICATREGLRCFGGDPEPIKLRPEERTQANTVYDRWGQSLTHTSSPFRSAASHRNSTRCLHGDYTFTADEMAGYNLFKGKGNCNSCHWTERDHS